MIDSHTHLDSCEPDDADLVAAAEREGVRRMLTVGTDPVSCRAALGSDERGPLDGGERPLVQRVEKIDPLFPKLERPAA